MSDDQNKKDSNKPFLHAGHNPKSRRDFLAQGLLGVSAIAFAPELLMRTANAQTAAGCAAPTTGKLTPVIIIDLAGGGNIPGSNVIVGGAGGQMDFLQTYSSLGLNANENPQLGNVNQDLGLAFHRQSGILAGIQSVAGVNTQRNMDGTIFATISNDDTSNNQHNPIYWLNKAGAKGDVTQLAGTQDSPSGGNSQAPAESINPTLQPVRVRSRTDALNLGSLGAPLSSFSKDKRDAIMDASANISKNKVESFNRRSLPDAIKNLVTCGFLNTPSQMNKVSDPAVINPDLDVNLTTIFNRIQDDGVRNVSKPIVKLVLDGFIGAGTITLGGYDYHDNTRASGDRKDRELGQLIGAIAEAAASKGKDVVIYVITDGGVGTNGAPDRTGTASDGRPVWTGDNGERSSSFMLVYKRDGKPAMRSEKRQIGYFQSNGAVSPTSSLTSNSVTNTAKAMVANYLALHGLEGRLEQVVGEDPFRLQLDKYLMFDKLR